MDYTYFDDPLMLGEYVRHYRKIKNMTQAQLAQAVGISRATISALERDNRKPSLRVMMSIANYIEMPVSFLFKGAESVILKNYIVGSTLIFPNGNCKNFDVVQACVGDDVDSDSLLCVSYNGCRYLADRDNTVDCDLVLCASNQTGECFVRPVSQLQGDESRDEYFVIAGIISEDITDLTLDILI